MAESNPCLTIELKSLSKKIRQYRAGEGVPTKETEGPNDHRNIVNFNLDPDGDFYISKTDGELDYKPPYEDALDQALNIMSKYAGRVEFTLLKMDDEADPKMGLRYLEQWCYSNYGKLAPETSVEPAVLETPTNPIAPESTGELPAIEALSVTKTIQILIDQDRDMAATDCIKKTFKALRLRNPPMTASKGYITKTFYAYRKELKQAEESK